MFLGKQTIVTLKLFNIKVIAKRNSIGIIREVANYLKNLRTIPNKNWIVLDFGAHNGFFSLICASRGA